MKISDIEKIKTNHNLWRNFMNSIIIYASQYGATQKYAEELSKRTNIPVISFKNIKDINSYDQIIYLGGLYAGGVLGMSNTLKKINDITNKTIILITVGLADPQDKENKNNIRKNMEKQLDKEVFKHAKIFHLRGAIDYKNLKFTHKTMMKLLYHAVKNLPEEKKSAEDKAMIDTYNQTVSFIDFSKLDPIVNEIHK